MRELLSIVPRPARYLGIEEGALRIEAISGQGALRCALAFPDMYEVGMSYLGQKILYGVLNEQPGMVAERVFTPCREAAELLRERGTPLTTLESDTPLAHMDVIGFSITHELCYTNVLYMLDLAGIPLRAADRASASNTTGENRSDGDRPDENRQTRWPLIVAGGGCTLAAEPLAPFVDVMVLGEGEESMPELVAVYGTACQRGLSRNACLRELTRLPGVYVPELFTQGPDGCLQPVDAVAPVVTDQTPTRTTLPRPTRPTRPTRRIVPDLDTAAYPSRQVVPFGAIHNRLSLEIARGCTRGCRFCQAGMIYRPARERTLPELKRLLTDCLRDTGFDEVSFLSLSTGDFSGLRGLFLDTADRCAAEQVSVALPSLRVGSIDDGIMERMAGIRRTGATLAPEAGSQRMRDIINKGITEEQLIDHVRRLAAHGWQQVKLYFMIGLPGETDEDLLAIVDLCRKVRDAARQDFRPRLLVTAAVSPFVPKAHTPFQWEAQISGEEIQRRVNLLRDAMRGEKNLKLRWHEPAMSVLEGILARGDRRLADVVEYAYRQGAIFCSWIEGFSLQPWLDGLQAAGLAVEEYTGPRALDAPLPWDHLESGVSRRFLLTERARAFRGAITPDCRYAHCRQCGVCDTKAGPAGVVSSSSDDVICKRLNFAARDQQPATTPIPPAPRKSEAATPQASQARKIPEGTSPELAVKAVRYRVWHTKLGRSAFISQLELQPLLERAMRRAELPLAFSQGFHPLPLISFGRALPVGVESESEWFSVTLRTVLGPEKVRGMLAPCLLAGMELRQIEPIPVKDKTLGPISERFLISATPEWQASFVAAWQAFDAASTFMWTHETKKGPRPVDLRPFIVRSEHGEDGITLITDWSTSYLSPLSLVRAVTPDIPLTSLRVLKRSQTLG